MLVDQALIVYRLGAVSAFKHFHDCAVGLESSLSQVRSPLLPVLAGSALPNAFSQPIRTPHPQLTPRAGFSVYELILRLNSLTISTANTGQRSKLLAFRF